MPRSRAAASVAAALLVLLAIGQLYRESTQRPLVLDVHDRTAVFPQTILWAWERPENLSFIDPRDVGVAFLAKTLRVRSEQVEVRPRLQPLLVPPETFLIAVARIETPLARTEPITPVQHGRLVSEITEMTRLQNIRAVQVDFDARASQRDWYRTLLTDVRRTLPDSMALSITALASWCWYDDWLDRMPVDEAVPMLFRMGPDGSRIRQLLTSGRDSSAALCRTSVGISTDEPMPKMPSRRRRYVFHPTSWTEDALRAIAE